MIPIKVGEGFDPRLFLTKMFVEMKGVQRYDIGFPGATDLAFPELSEILTGQLLNNVGDPEDPGLGRNHTKPLEREVVAAVADIFHAPEERWGYVTTGSTESVLHALDDARRYYPDSVVYTSAAAHYSIAKSAHLVGLPLVIVPTYPDGSMDISRFRSELAPRRGRPATVVATAGTTMTEAVDDVPGIVAVCEEFGVIRRRIHVDAALSGIPLALLPDRERPGFDFATGVTSMAVSGHKFLGTLMPCGVLVYARPSGIGVLQKIPYTGSVDSTITGSRSGHAPLILWWVLSTLGVEGLRRRARASRNLARYTHGQIQGLGWPTRINPNAFTVTLAEPPQAVLAKWVLAREGRTAHIVCMPGMCRDQIDEFVHDLRRALACPATREPHLRAI